MWVSKKDYKKIKKVNRLNGRVAHVLECLTYRGIEWSTPKTWYDPPPKYIESIFAFDSMEFILTEEGIACLFNHIRAYDELQKRGKKKGKEGQGK